MKTTVGTKLDGILLERLKRVAEVDRRTLSNVVELCILRGLPALEDDLVRRKLIVPAPADGDYTSRGPQGAAALNDRPAAPAKPRRPHREP